MASLLEAGFKQSVRMIADHMGFRIEPNIRTIQDVAVATSDIDYAPFPITTGTVAARRFRWQALVDGEPVITAAVNWLMGEENLDPAWNFEGRGERFEVEITGDPDVKLTFKGLQPETIAEGLVRNPGVVVTANHCVNAIPDVCAAEPGIKTYLDLPLFAGRPAPNLCDSHHDRPARDVSFCHLVVGVTDMDRALAFYRDVLGMEVVFETLISGEPFDAVLHASRKQEGRVVGGLLGGLMVELLSLGAKPAAEKPGPPGAITGIHNVSLSVTDLDDTHRRIIDAGYTPDQDPFEIGGVRMFFVKDPDGTPVEFIELPGGVRSTYEMHRGVRTADGTGQMSYSHPDSMRGHVAIVTGAAQGVGKGVAAALLERGASVLLVDIQDEKLGATTDELQALGRAEQAGRRSTRPGQRTADRRGRGRRLRHGARPGQQRHRHQ